MTTDVAKGTGARRGARDRPWGRWWGQVLSILRLEVRKSFLGRRAFALYLLAAAPVAIFLMRALWPDVVEDRANVPEATLAFATLYQAFILRLVLFFGCVGIFGNLIRREILDRSLHYYFLSPVRREVLAAAKYLTGLTVSTVLFGLTTLASFLLAYAPYDGRAVQRVLLAGPGLGHLLAYLGVTVLGCVGYGAVFLALSFFFKSPAIPAVVVFGWEFINFLLPPLLKKLSVIYYLQSLCPVPVSQGPLALLADAPSPWLAIPGLVLVTALLLAVSAWKIRRMEISYEED